MTETPTPTPTAPTSGEVMPTDREVEIIRAAQSTAVRAFEAAAALKARAVEVEEDARRTITGMLSAILGGYGERPPAGASVRYDHASRSVTWDVEAEGE